MLKEHYSIKDYWPLVAIFATGVVLAGIAWVQTADWMTSMNFFMGGVLLLLSSLKISNLKEFAMAFQTYDLVAGRSKAYARTYPFLEFLLGVGYLLGVYAIAVNTITLFVMTIGAVGVWRKMNTDEVLMCACLGAVFNVPMTWVTLAEDLLMAAMAAGMLIVLL